MALLKSSGSDTFYLGSGQYRGTHVSIGDDASIRRAKRGVSPTARRQPSRRPFSSTVFKEWCANDVSAPDAENGRCAALIERPFQARIYLKNRISPMETLLINQTTADDKIITPSWNLLFSQPVGGRNVSAVRSLSGDSSRSRWPRPATEGRRSGGPQIPCLRGHTRWIVYLFLIKHVVDRDQHFPSCRYDRFL